MMGVDLFLGSLPVTLAAFSFRHIPGGDGVISQVGSWEENSKTPQKSHSTVKAEERLNLNVLALRCLPHL